MPADKPHRPAPLERTAYHEAGHAAASFILGRRVLEVSIVRDEAAGSLGCCLNSDLPAWFDPCSETAPGKLRAFAEREILIQFAGGAAEARICGRKNFLGARKDRISAIDVALAFICGSTEEAGKYLSWLAVRANHLFDRPGEWQAVEAIARGLLEKLTLTGREARIIYRAAQEACFQRWRQGNAENRKRN